MKRGAAHALKLPLAEAEGEWGSEVTPGAVGKRARAKQMLQTMALNSLQHAWQENFS